MIERLLIAAVGGLAGSVFARRLVRRQAARPLVHGGMQWWTPCQVRRRPPGGTWSRRRTTDLRLDGPDALLRRVRRIERLTPDGATATLSRDDRNPGRRNVLIEWPDGRAVEVGIGWAAAEQLCRAFGG